VLPYLAAAWPYRSVTDAGSGAANRGWRWFIAMNYAVGFLVTMLLIWWALIRP
jgi:ABC-type multidrug transport system permease subunit